MFDLWPKDIFEHSDAWTKRNRFSLIMFPRSNQPVYFGTTSSGARPSALPQQPTLFASGLDSHDHRRQEVEPIDEEGKGGQPVVTGILQGTLV
jgi:hypothetical protein